MPFNNSEALINNLASEIHRVDSAGSKPTGYVYPKSIEALNCHSILVGSPRSKSWDEFEGKKFDLLITVCDAAANVTCPIFLGNHTKLH